jgi:hypothetical protein
MPLIYRLFFAIMGAKLLQSFARELAKRRVWRLKGFEIRRRGEGC